MGWAAQSPQPGSQLDPPRAEIEVPPRDATGGCRSATGSCGRSAGTPGAVGEGHGDDHDRGLELHGGDVDGVEAREALECSGDAHGQATSGSQVLKPVNLGRGPCASPADARNCPLSHLLQARTPSPPRPHQGQESRISRHRNPAWAHARANCLSRCASTLAYA